MRRIRIARSDRLERQWTGCGKHGPFMRSSGIFGAGAKDRGNAVSHSGCPMACQVWMWCDRSSRHRRMQDS